VSTSTRCSRTDRFPIRFAEQLENGRTIIVELDAWHLPDTAATSYHAEHVKTSVAVEAIDRQGERLRYFHNRSLHELAGDDYRGAFGLASARGAEAMSAPVPSFGREGQTFGGTSRR